MDNWGEKHEKINKIITDYWNLFKHDYAESDETIYYQITCRILHEVNVWINRDNEIASSALSKLLELNKKQDYNIQYKKVIIDMLEANKSISLEQNTYRSDGVIRLRYESNLKDSNVKKAMSYVLDKLKRNNDDISIASIHFNTISILRGDFKQKVRIISSKNYCSESYMPYKLCCSWHNTKIQFLEKYDYFVFVVECGNSYKGLIFTNYDFIEHLSKRRLWGDNLNFYFHWNEDGSVTDERSKGSIDVSKFDADNKKWKLPPIILEWN